MKILVLKSSGNRNGSSNTLADAFIRGCGSAGMTKRSPYLQQAYELGRSLCLHRFAGRFHHEGLDE